MTDTETCERCANRDPLDRLDHGHVRVDETPEADEFADIPPLAKSITDQLTDLAAHACVHGHHDERAGTPTPEEMPPCLADHVGSLAATLFELTRPEERDSTITTTIEVPVDLPEGLVEGLQKAVRDVVETLGKQA